MKTRNNNNKDFTDYLLQDKYKKINKGFLLQIDRTIDWDKIRKMINSAIWTRQSNGKKVGPPVYDSVLMFKILLLETWYGLSDVEVEYRINDSLSFSSFCGLSISELSPDHSTISRFRSRLTNAGLLDNLLYEINRQLEEKGILVKQGVLVDASIVDTPRKPKGKKQYEVKEQSDGKVKVEPIIASSVDKEADWIKKGNEIRYGYKKHYICEDRNGLVLAVDTMPASFYEGNFLFRLLKKITLPEGIPLKADKGYCSKNNSELLKRLKFKDHIQKKATRSRKLTKWEMLFNKLIGKTRYKVERTFGSIKLWFRGGIARYVGIAKMHTQNVLEAISYNLYRLYGITMRGR